MRQWIKLVESAADNRLYHGTSLIGFCHIADSNMLAANGGEGQASFTLDPAVARKFTQSAIDLCSRGQLMQYQDYYDCPKAGWNGDLYNAHKAELVAGSHGAVIAFDRAALHRDYQFHAVCFHSPGLPTLDSGYSGDEQEECVLEENVTNLEQYVVGVSAPNFDVYSAYVREHLSNDPVALQVVAAGEAWVRKFG